MSDYKDMLAGALDKMVEKVKDYTDGKSAREIYEEGVEKISGYGKRAMLMLDVTGAKEQLKKAYEDLGRQYFNDAKDSHGHEYDELFETIEELRNEIIAKEDEIDAIKYGDGSDEKDIDVEIIEYGEVVDDIGDK